MNDVMQKCSVLLCFMAGIMLSVCAQRPAPYDYGVPDTPWLESFGNHRAKLYVGKATEAASLNFEWRRADRDADKRHFIIVNATTGDTVANIQRICVNDEVCRLQFGPIQQAGVYYFYYLPYQTQTDNGYYHGDYLAPEPQPDVAWLKRVVKMRKKPQARVMQVQARTQFDSFFPMEIAATQSEMQTYANHHAGGCYVFAEDRSNPIRMQHKIPAKWLHTEPATTFSATAAPNEYFTFQLGVWATDTDVDSLTYLASDLRSTASVIPSSAFTCFNMEGVNAEGKPFRQQVDVPSQKVQALWFGIDIPAEAKEGIYEGIITLSDKDGRTWKQPLRITIAGAALPDRGDSQLWRHSRLRWLNSTLGIADSPTLPYTPLTISGDSLCCRGRMLKLSHSTLLPQQIAAATDTLLNSSIRFVIETARGEKQLSARPIIEEQTAGHIDARWRAEDEELSVEAKMRMEFDGWVNYVYDITAKKDVEVSDIRLIIPVKSERGKYFLGAGLQGQDTPIAYEGKWDAPMKEINHLNVSLPTDETFPYLWPFDSFWIGDAHIGIHCELRGSSYSGPLLNAYRPPYPESWNNKGRGGFRIARQGNATQVIAYSGNRTLVAGQHIAFDFAFIITPVKQPDFKSQFLCRYYHNGTNPVPTADDVRAGIKVINVHHANAYNPFINYPFLTADKIKALTNEWHAKGCKVKLYYTMREISTAATELWAMRSLGHEILRDGQGGGYPWCREHLVEGYTPQWYSHFRHRDETGIEADAAVLTSESGSRWYNYYVEGLQYMVKNMGIDGLYIDDVSFGRDILKRMRRAMDCAKQGCIIDLHSNTGFSRGPANQYAEIFPYIDKVWFGESFDYNKMTPANYLVESSGIPFGLTGDMLYRGGNKWLGMQYGMTVRHPWETEGIICDPRFVWKVWDSFGIQDAQVIGFWESNVPVTTSDEAVKVTVYKKMGCSLLSIGNYSDETKSVMLHVDWASLGIDPTSVRIYSPEVETFQPSQEWQVGEPVTIAPRKGWLIYLQSQ